MARPQGREGGHAGPPHPGMDVTLMLGDRTIAEPPIRLGVGMGGLFPVGGQPSCRDMERGRGGIKARSGAPAGPGGKMGGV